MKYISYDNEDKDYLGLTDEERKQVDELTDLYLECGRLRSPELFGDHKKGFKEAWKKYNERLTEVGLEYRYRCVIIHEMIADKLEENEETQTNFSKLDVEFIVNPKII